MSREFMVMVEAMDTVCVEANDAESAKRNAIEMFVAYPRSAAFNAEIMRETDEDGNQTFLDTTVAEEK